MEKHLTVGKFLNDCYSWLYEPRNRCVESFHYDTCEASDAMSVDEIIHNKKVRATIRAFLGQRLWQGEGIRPADMPRWFMSRAVTKYLENMYK